MLRAAGFVSAVLLALALSSCGSTAVYFSPVSPENEGANMEALTPLVGRALVVGAEDQKSILEHDAVLVGWVVVEQGDVDVEMASDAVRDQAAVRGGTHVFVPGSRRDEVSSRDRPSVHGPDSPAVVRVRAVQFAVYRVPQRAWEGLPSHLVP